MDFQAMDIQESELANKDHLEYLNALQSKIGLVISFHKTYPTLVEGIYDSAIENQSIYAEVAKKTLRDFTGNQNANVIGEYRFSANDGTPNMSKILRSLRNAQKDILKILKESNVKPLETKMSDDLEGKSALFGFDIERPDIKMSEFLEKMSELSTKDPLKSKWHLVPANMQIREFLNSDLNYSLNFGSGSFFNYIAIAKQIAFQSPHKGFESLKNQLTAKQLSSPSYADDVLVYDANKLEKGARNAVVLIRKDYLSSNSFETIAVKDESVLESRLDFLVSSAESYCKSDRTLKDLDVYYVKPDRAIKVKNNSELEAAFARVSQSSIFESNNLREMSEQNRG